jgi:hypothetical protein
VTDSFIRLPVDDIGKELDTELLTNGRHRERMEIAGALVAEISRVLNTDPAAGDYALVVRQAAPDSPQVVTASVVSVAPGSTGSVDSNQITAGLTAKLMLFAAVSSRPFKVELQTVFNGIATTRDVRFGWHGDVTWISPHKDFIQQAQDAGAGFDGFRLVFTHLDTGAVASDFYGTFYYDEVA